MESTLHRFHPAVCDWFKATFEAPTSVQEAAWQSIANRENSLIAAPTGAGKTLAAFLAVIDQLVTDGLRAPLEERVYVLYISPLKALSNDIQKNLAAPLEGIQQRLAATGSLYSPLRSAVRTGDTPQSERDEMRRRPPHILVTTPESLFILLTSASGREMLGRVAAVIVDEIHALAGNKRGAHLALSLARLDALNDRAPVRIGLSATQRPMKRIARYLCGERPCQLVDVGYSRERDLAMVVPQSPLTAVMANEVWAEIYDQLAAFAASHRTTLIFVNTRRHAERIARHLAERIGEEAVTAHHGSLAREHRLDAEQRLKSGQLKALVATASLELGIDIGDIDLVCQIGSPRSLAGFLQRVGRSGHAVKATPKGRLFPLSLDDLVECAALLRAVSMGDLDTIHLHEGALDVLAQQIVAEVAGRPWNEDELYQCLHAAWPYRKLTREQFANVVKMVAEGFATRRGRRSAYIHRDGVNGELRPRRAARLTAITNGGTIPDQFDYQVVMRPQDYRVGTLNEDFAFESLPGDIFQLGNTSYRILKVNPGKVFVEDARGQPTNIPFWFGEAPGRSDELSDAVSRLRGDCNRMLDESGPEGLRHWLVDELDLHEAAAHQLSEYLAKAHAALGGLPTHERIVLERFFDETGDMHVVLHSTYGSRVNRALGLCLRKKFCRKFNFELQAAALEDSLVLSLGPTHSFPLREVAGYVRSTSARETLIQAVLQAPMFGTRWRWVATNALAIRRCMGGERRPPQFQRNDAEDLVAVVFPDQLACQDNVVGPREVPDHPLIEQTLVDCLSEVMDIDGLEQLLKRIEAGEIQVDALDLVQPSPLADAVINARPYAFLDDGAAEERRTLAIRRRDVSLDEAGSLATLSPDALETVGRQSWPRVRDGDELHDALMTAGFVLEGEWRQRDPESAFDYGGSLNRLVAEGRAVAFEQAHQIRYFARERWHLACAAYGAEPHKALEDVPEAGAGVVELLRRRLEIAPPITLAQLHDDFGLDATDLRIALATLEGEGFALVQEINGVDHWCERRNLARIHALTLRARRSYFQPVSVAAYSRFLERWHGISQPEGVGVKSLERVLAQLEGCAMPAAIWEQEVLPARLADYRGEQLDELCGSGRWVWLRLRGESAAAVKLATSQTPVAIVRREHLDFWLPERAFDGELSSSAQSILDALQQHGASFAAELEADSRLLRPQLEEALGELVASGLITTDTFAGIRYLASGARLRERRRRYAARGVPTVGLDEAGRISVLRTRSPRERWEQVAAVARTLLRRYGVVFHALVSQCEEKLPPWRDLLYVLERMEARDEIHGGRFVAGFSGEQFADKAAARGLKATKGVEKRTVPIILSACDPLNLSGAILGGDRVPARAGNRLALLAGQAVAAQISGQIERYTADVSSQTEQFLRVAPAHRAGVDMPTAQRRKPSGPPRMLF